jgi:hypothetical protein
MWPFYTPGEGGGSTEMAVPAEQAVQVGEGAAQVLLAG